MSTIRNGRAVLSYLYKKLGNATQAQIVWVLWIWRPYARVKRDGHAWIIKTDEELIKDGVTSSPRAIRHALTKLEEAQIITRTRGPHIRRGAPNARYLWISDELFDELEGVAAEGKLKSRRVDQDTQAELERTQTPRQNGNSRRFHKQKTNNNTNTDTSIFEEKRSTAKRVSKDKITEEEHKIQAGFCKGASERTPPYYASPLDHHALISGVRRFWKAIRPHVASIDEAAEVARHFAQTYDPDHAALMLAAPKTSPQPNQILLGALASDALSCFRASQIVSTAKAKSADDLFGGEEDGEDDAA